MPKINITCKSKADIVMSVLVLSNFYQLTFSGYNTIQYNIVNIIIPDNSVEKVKEVDGEPSQNISDTEVKEDIETEKKEGPNVEINSESTTVAAETTQSESSREPTTDNTNESPTVNQSSTEAETSCEPTNVDTDNTATSESATGAA